MRTVIAGAMGLNPLLSGSVFLTPSLLYDEEFGCGRLNPLLSGSVFLTLIW